MALIIKEQDKEIYFKIDPNTSYMNFNGFYIGFIEYPNEIERSKEREYSTKVKEIFTKIDKDYSEFSKKITDVYNIDISDTTYEIIQSTLTQEELIAYNKFISLESMINDITRTMCRVVNLSDEEYDFRKNNIIQNRYYSNMIEYGFEDKILDEPIIVKATGQFFLAEYDVDTKLTMDNLYGLFKKNFEDLVVSDI